MRVTYGGREAVCAPGSTAMECLNALDAAQGAVAAIRNGSVLELHETLEGDGEVKPITLRDDEGRRIYERSLRFVMLLALRRLYPAQQVRIEFSAGHGVFVRLPGIALSREAIAAIEREMRAITDADLPFTAKTWQLQDAISYFEQDGQPDKVELLKLRPYSYFKMYCLDGMWEYFYGAMTPSTGYVRVFALAQHAPGFVLQMPDGVNNDVPAPYVNRPKHLAAFSQSTTWCEILGVNNAADLTAMVKSGRMREFIRINEALHDKAIGAIADRVIRSGAQLIMVAGPSSSGKTTFARRLGVHLRVMGFHPVQISLDDYYLNRDILPREADGSVDLESIHTLDLPLFRQQMQQLLAGETVELPHFNFPKQKRDEHGTLLTLPAGEPLIIEGIHGLNPLLCEGIPESAIHRVFVSALTCLNLDDHNRIRTTDVRLLRRTVRDHQFRGTEPVETMRMWPSVRKGEETWIFPWQEAADSVFNTALHYELPFLKACVYDLLDAIPQDDPCALSARRLLKTLHYIPDVPKELWDEIPPTSILREFIGGSTFDKD